MKFSSDTSCDDRFDLLTRFCRDWQWRRLILRDFAFLCEDQSPRPELHNRAKAYATGVVEAQADAANPAA